MKIVLVNDKMQTDYRYNLVAPVGDNFNAIFQPQLTPKEMLQLGVFGGKYLNDCKSEYPQDWFLNAKLSPFKKNIKLNYFSVDASQPLSEWNNKGWIHPKDPRGWFQWYCRYYLGRRMEDEDLRQIKRWRAFSRHAGAIKKYCEPYDFSCRKKQRQALLHWAYDSRKLERLLFKCKLDGYFFFFFIVLAFLVPAALPEFLIFLGPQYCAFNPLSTLFSNRIFRYRSILDI